MKLPSVKNRSLLDDKQYQDYGTKLYFRYAESDGSLFKAKLITVDDDSFNRTVYNSFTLADH